ncbi:MAG: GntR family transcriptional regulator, partial [Porticoccaceae bacterium]|nr:GntR family transcriptional regulator [Porticoccaceae bacterium]
MINRTQASGKPVMQSASLEIRDYLAAQIAAGKLCVNARLPSERELVEQFNSTRITVRDALSKLESEGLIYRSNRRGWFVTPSRLEYDPSSRVNFYMLAAQQNKEPATELISRRCI